MAGMLPLYQLLEREIEQRYLEGASVERGEWRERLEKAGPQDRRALEALYDELAALPVPLDVPFQEPSDLEAIRAARPKHAKRLHGAVLEKDLFDHIHGGWLGRCCGCALGKPFEMDPYFHDPERQQRKRIQQWLEGAAAWPLSFYVPERSLAQRIGLGVLANGCTDDAIEAMEADDDLNDTLVGLAMLEERGVEFATADVAEGWLRRLTFEAAPDKQVYVNLVSDERFAWQGRSREAMEGADWGALAAHRNPFRESVRARSRADVYGYISPGNPERAAELAWRDARLSHVRNGIYGAMFTAAAIAAAFVEQDPYRLVELGHAEIPVHSRLAVAIRSVVRLSRKHADWRDCWDAVMGQFAEYPADHVIPNTLIVVMGLLYGKGAFEGSICMAVSGGLDANGNGATVGSILGVAHGARRIPKKWSSPLGNTLKSGVLGYTQATITDCSRRTAKALEKRVKAKS